MREERGQRADAAQKRGLRRIWSALFGSAAKPEEMPVPQCIPADGISEAPVQMEPVDSNAGDFDRSLLASDAVLRKLYAMYEDARAQGDAERAEDLQRKIRARIEYREYD